MFQLQNLGMSRRWVCLPTYQDSVRIPHIDDISPGALHLCLGYLKHSRVQPGEWGMSGKQQWNERSYNKQ
jgi:hypothetical protein